MSDNLLISLREWHKIYFFASEHRTKATPRKCVRQPTSQFCSICKSIAYRKLYCVKPSSSYESFFIRQRSSSRQQTASHTDNTSSHNRDLFGLKHVHEYGLGTQPVANGYASNVAQSLLTRFFSQRIVSRCRTKAFANPDTLVWIVLCFPHEKMRKRTNEERYFGENISEKRFCSVNTDNKRKESTFYCNILIYLSRCCTPLQEDGS